MGPLELVGAMTSWEPPFGTVIVTEPTWWPPRLTGAASLGIQAVQAARGYPAPFRHATHCRLVLWPDQILDCTSPKVKWSDWANVRRERWRAYVPLFSLEDTLMRQGIMEAAYRLIGRRYDYGQLVSMLASDLLGYTQDRRLAWFDGRRRTVCSPAARVPFEFGRHLVEAAGRPAPFAQLFIGRSGAKILLESTHPADYGYTPGVRVAGAPPERLFAEVFNWRIAP